ncbi:UNVERIFIED_CONTAM: Alkane hydroxylase MAH1 [Sesamum latifolium]|uniref:Alkane hydroxylase MAH1 n=1 Tax=Sesamum latifolium TaxID=2727402 RepID=A0AAW2WNE6_9LAMI
MLVCYRYVVGRKEKSSLPTNWPILGMLPALLKNGSRFHQFMMELVEQSGGTFVFKGPWFTNMDMMITSDPANVHYILTKNFPNFSKGPEFKEILDVFGDGIFAAEYESWSSQRKTTKALMTQLGFQELAATTSWNKVETGLVPVMELVSETGTEVDVQELFQRLTFDCSCILVLGHDPTSLCKELPHLPYEKAFADIGEAALYRHILPQVIWKLQRWLQVGKERKLKQGMEHIDRFLSHCISLKQQSYTAATEPGREDFDILSSYMRAVNVEGNGDDAPDIFQEFRRDNLLNLIMAGKDTISATLTWFFWLLATHPAEEEKIRLEIYTNFQVGKWKFTNMQELRKLIYLHGALCEALRLFPPVAVQHKAPVEHDILPTGHPIQPNTITLLSFYAMGRMESIWGEDCLQFKPGRWISETGRIRIEPSYKFTAFNAGPRSCLGKEMSFTQMKIVAAAIISRFKIQVAEGHPVCPNASIVLHMKHGLKVKVSKYE